MKPNFCNVEVLEDLNQQLLRLTDCGTADDLLHPIETDIKPIAYELPRTGTPVNQVIDCIDGNPGTRPVVNPAPTRATTAPIIQTENDIVMQRRIDYSAGARIGIVDPEAATQAANQALAVATGVVNFFKSFGSDQVPAYPITQQSTLQKLQAAVAAEFPLPPKSVEDAKAILARVQAARAIKVTETGNAAKTVVMMYDEIITALGNYIAAGGGVYSPVAPGTAVPQSSNYQLPGAPVPEQQNALTAFVTKNPVLVLGGVVVAAYLLTRKRRR